MKQIKIPSILTQKHAPTITFNTEIKLDFHRSNSSLLSPTSVSDINLTNKFPNTLNIKIINIYYLTLLVLMS